METLRRFKPKLFIEIDEVNLRRFGASTGQIFTFLKEAGYSVLEPDTRMKVRDTVVEHADVLALALD